MKRNGKRGFTIVELVVVIAVVAILAAVLIPTFASVIKKANVSNDVVLVKELNDGLKMEEVGGKKNDTMTDALNVAKDYGFEVEKLTPRSSGEILWDSVNNRFVLLDENGDAVYKDESKTLSSGANLWKIVNNAEEAANNTKYSSYIKGNATIDTLTVTNGVDVGENTVANIVYANAAAHDVVIRTDSYDTVVNVNAAAANVKHYGQAKEINIAEVAMTSYHEYGDIMGNINVAKGNVEIENGAKVPNVVISSVTVGETTVTPAANTEVKVQVKEEAKVNTVQSKVNAVKAETVTTVKGTTEVATIEKNDENVAYVGKTGYKTFNAALTQASKLDNSTITLTNDCKHLYLTNLGKGNQITIDLNGYELTHSTNSSMFNVYNGTNLTIKNGKITANNVTYGTNALISSSTSSCVYAYNVTIETTSSVFYPKGDAAKVVIENCNVNAGVYAVATNAGKVDNYGVIISIKNSELRTKGFSGNDGDDCTIMINVSGTLNIEDSKIYGHRMGVAVRAGVANIKNTTISADLGNSKFINLYLDSVWGSGNEIPSYPLVVGDTSSGAYDANAVCNLVNVKIVNAGASNTDRFIYMANDGKYTTELTFDSASSGTTYVIRKDSTVTVNGTQKVGE